MNPSPKIRLHTFAKFDRGAKVRWLLHELGVAFEERVVDRAKKENESPEYLKMNPMGRVPVLEIDGTVFFESGAICTYLADLYPEKRLAPPMSNPRERAQYLQWMFFASATIDTIQTRIMVIEDIEEGSAVRIKKEAALMSDWRDALTSLDRALAKSGYLVGDRLTAADICVSYHLYRCTLWPELDVHLNDFTQVRNFLERMKQMPAAVRNEVFTQGG